MTHVVSHSFSLIQNRTVDYCARIAHLTQSFASANAKLCNRQRKALQQPTQSFAIANAKLCNRQRKALHKRCLHNQKWNLFLIYSDYLLAENTLTSTRCKRKSVIILLLSTLLRLQRDHNLHKITQGVAALYPGLCAFAFTARQLST